MSTVALRWLASFTHRGRPGDGEAPTLTIVRHHRVFADDEQPLYRLGVSAWVLREQLRMLASEGLAPVTVAEGLEHLAHGRGHKVALSFDDGYRDNLTRALPLLEEHGARATFYLTAGWIEHRTIPWWDAVAHALSHTRRTVLDSFAGDAGPILLATRTDRVRALERLAPRFRVPLAERDARVRSLRERLGVENAPACELATWDEARVLTRTPMEIGAHTLNHPHLTTLTPAEQEREMEGSVALIAERLGVRPRGLAYPGGDHDAETLAAAGRSGLDYAATTRAGLNRGDAPRLALARRGFSEGTCVGPLGRFSRRLALAELSGAFDHLRAQRRAS
jgi:peptidoglycan/xylan/chitin deacetylase (PgdA/CDA1 family)